MTKKKTNRIAVLTNRHHFLLQNVFLIELETNYILFVIHDGKLILQQEYETKRGARIAFKRSFNCRTFRDVTKAIWTHFYTPDGDWFNELEEIIKKGIQPLNKDKPNHEVKQ